MARGETPARLVPPLHRCGPSMNLKRATDHSTRKAAGAAVAPGPTNGNGHGGNGHASVPGASAHIGDGQAPGMRVFPVICLPSLLRAAIESAYENTRAGLASALSEAEADVIPVEETHDSMNLSELRASADQVPVVRLVTMILVEGIQRGASD